MNYYNKINKKLIPKLVKTRGGANPAIHEWNPNLWRGFSTVLPHLIENTNLSVEQKIYLFLKNKAAPTNRPLESLFPFTIHPLPPLNNVFPPFQVTLSHLQMLELHEQDPDEPSNFKIQGLGSGNGPVTTGENGRKLGNYLDRLKHAAHVTRVEYGPDPIGPRTERNTLPEDLLRDLEEGNLENLIDILTP